MADDKVTKFKAEIERMKEEASKTENMEKEVASLNEKLKKVVSFKMEKLKKTIEDKDGEIVKARSEANHSHNKVARLEEDYANQERKLKAVERRELQNKRREAKDLADREASVAAREAEPSVSTTLDDLKLQEIKRDIQLNFVEEFRVHEWLTTNLLDEVAKKTATLLENKEESIANKTVEALMGLAREVSLIRASLKKTDDTMLTVANASSSSAEPARTSVAGSSELVSFKPTPEARS